MGSTTSPVEMGQAIGEAIGGAIIFLWVILVVIGVLFIAYLVWFIWVMTRIKQEASKTNRLLGDLKNILKANQTQKTNATTGPSVSDELTKYKALLDNGAITEEEYNLKKIQLLNK